MIEHIFHSEEIFCNHLRNELVSLLNTGKGSKNIALSGGSTPLALFNLLGNQPLSDDLDNHVNVFWVDERYVPINDTRNNATIASDRWLKHEDKMVLYPVDTAISSIDDCARAYQDAIQKVNGFHFDLILLGMGLDGHIASIFPGQKHTTSIFSCNHPTDSTERISFSIEAIAKASEVWLLLKGKDKRVVLQDKMGLPIHQLLDKKLIKLFYLD